VKVDKQLIYLAASTVIVLVLGTVGFYQNTPEIGFLTSLYLTVQLFAMESGVVDTNPTPLLIELSRWLALGTLVGAVYATVQALLGHFRTSLRIAFTKEHAIICGAGMRGVVLARAFKTLSNKEVVVIELDENNPALGELRNQNIEVIIGNAIDASILQKAGISKARTLVAVTGDDERNLSICTEVSRELNQDCELSAGIESWSWRTYFLDRMRSKIRLDSYLSRATRSLLLQVATEAVKESRFRKQNVHILMDISDHKRQEFVRSAIIMLQIAGDKRPTIELTSVGPGQKEAFLDRFPACDLVADLRWHRESASQVFVENTIHIPDFAIFALDSDIDTLEAAERFWMRHDIPDHHVTACLHGDSDATNVERLQKKVRDFSVINLLKLGVGSKDPLEPDIEQRAQICHAIYFNNEKIKNPNYGSGINELPERWRDLSERLKDSNRLAAMHHEVKRHAWHARGDVDASSTLTHLSRCEHMRWMAEKAMEGWRWSGSHEKSSRDNNKLKHHLLVSYDALENPEKDKDFNAFLWALDLTDQDLHDLAIPTELKRMIELAKNLNSGT
jgi:hypothetical protein